MKCDKRLDILTKNPGTQIVFYYKNCAVSKRGMCCKSQIDNFVTIDKNTINV